MCSYLIWLVLPMGWGSPVEAGSILGTGRGSEEAGGALKKEGEEGPETSGGVVEKLARVVVGHGGRLWNKPLGLSLRCTPLSMVFLGFVPWNVLGHYSLHRVQPRPVC